MQKIKFSIIIPVYNTEKYLEKCLKSVFNQVYEAYEVIIVNDGSSDNSETIIFKYKEKYKNIKYIKQENKGLSIARNIGLINAVGEYIIWLDSDDALVENALTLLSELIKEKPDVVINRISSYSEKNNKITECNYKFNVEPTCSTREEVQKYLCHLKGFWFAAWCFISKREFLIKNKIEFMPNIYHEDELWSATLLCKANFFVFNNNCYYINTSMRQDSIIFSKNIKKDFDLLLVVKELFYSAKREEKNKKFLQHRILRLLYSVYKRIKLSVNEEKTVELEKEFNILSKNIYSNRINIIKVLFKLRLILEKINKQF